MGGYLLWFISALYTISTMKTFIFILAIYYLWNISKPGKTGIPQNELMNDKDININDKGLTSTQLALERVIAKTFSHYS